MAVVASPVIQGELEQQLKDTGNRLATQTLPVDELLSLLDRVEHYLSRVEQSPPKSMLDALSLSLNALIGDRYLRHSDADVKVAVASCISEITRITAPDAPYEDEKMKDVFQLIVSSFEDLSDQSSRSYTKRASILETVAKVRSCVVMLDLECDGLIVEMFQHFLKAIRDYHPENVFSSMETIMTLVLEESEDISLELLTPLLASVKKDNEDVLPVARKLGEKVFEKAADKLKPYLAKAVKSLGVSLEDYSQVVAVICNETSGASEQNDDNASGQQAEEVKLIKASSEDAAQVEESKLTTASSEETTQVAKESVTERPSPEEASPAVDRSPKSVMSNGVMETGNEETSVDQESLKKPEPDQPANESLNVDLTSKPENNDSDAGKSSKSESKTEQTAKKKGRKSNHVTNSKEPSDLLHADADSEKEPEKLQDRRKSRSKDVQSSLGEDPSIEADTPSENENDTATLPSSPKAEVETTKTTVSSPSRSLPDESRSKKGGRTKKKPISTKVDGPSTDVASTKAPEGTSESEVKLQKRPGKKVPAGTTKEDKVPGVVVKSKSEDGSVSGSEGKTPKQASKKVDADVEDDEDTKPLRQSVKKGDKGDSEAKSLKQSGKKGLKTPEPKPLLQAAKKGDASTSEAKAQKQSGKKGNTSHAVEDKPSLKSKEEGKKRGRGQDATEKDLSKSHAEDDEMVSSPKSTTKSTKEEDHIEEPNTTSSKRKRTPGKEKVSETAEHGADLIGSKIKVWWPKDRAFYDGVVKSYDSAKKKHMVHYTDDEVEILNLKKERWEFIEDDSMSDGADEDSSPNGSPEMHKKKKKAKTDREPSPAQDAMEISPKSKSKASASKSGRKTKVEEKADNKSKDNASKSGGKSVDQSNVKSKDKSQKSSGKSVDETPAPKSGTKSKDVDVSTPKTTSKSKQDASKTVSKSKGKTPQTGSKSNGSGKLKSSSSKVVKESDNEKETSVDSEKTTEDVKEKSPEPPTSKARDTGSKSGKKRKKRS